MGSDRLRIAVCGFYGLPALYGGVERHVEELYSRLAARGHDVTIYCRAHYTHQEGDYRGMHLRRLPAWPTKHLENPTHTLQSSLDALFRCYDLVHFQADLAALFSFIPRLVRSKTVVTLHGLDWQREKWGRVARAVIRAGELAAMAFPDATIVVSQALRAYCRQAYRKEAIYIPNGVNIPALRPPERIRQWGLAPNGYILSVGRLVPEKGYHYLLEAFKGLPGDLKLVIVGGSRHSDGYEKRLLADKDPRLVFPGYVYGQALEELYSNARLYVQPSTVEGLPLTVLEAMSYGRCVLASDIPANREAVGNCGYTFRSRDVGDLRQLLEELLVRPGEVEAAGRRARAWVAREYGWERIASATDDLFRQVVKA